MLGRALISLQDLLLTCMLMLKIFKFKAQIQGLNGSLGFGVMQRITITLTHRGILTTEKAVLLVAHII